MRLLLATAIGLFSAAAYADPVPESIAKQVKVFSPEAAQLSDGALRVRIPRPVVTQEVFRNVARSTCFPLWLSSGKDAWKGAKIERVEVVNQIGAQGFALVGGRKACSDIGKISGDAKADEYIARNTWVCVAGMPCRPRRDGEKTSGDE